MLYKEWIGQARIESGRQTWTVAVAQMRDVSFFISEHEDKENGTDL